MQHQHLPVRSDTVAVLTELVEECLLANATAAASMIPENQHSRKEGTRGLVLEICGPRQAGSRVGKPWPPGQTVSMT